jgi:hypothetical protein
MGYPHRLAHRPKEGFLPNPKLKFLDQCREVMRFKQLSRRTEETYWQWIRRFILFHRRPSRGLAATLSAPGEQVIRPAATFCPSDGREDGAHGVTHPTGGLGGWRRSTDAPPRQFAAFDNGGCESPHPSLGHFFPSRCGAGNHWPGLLDGGAAAVFTGS